MVSPTIGRILPPAALVLLFLAALTSVAADSTPAKEGARQAKERPPQTPVLAANSVKRLNIAYGEDEKQRLDVYAPRDAKGAAIVMFVHGGEWTRGDKANVSYKPKFLNENGIIFMSINYRLTPPATHPAHVGDVAAAVRWVHDHAADFGGDGKKITLMGHSAGCHLVTLAALDPRYLAAVKLRPADLAGVVAWSGGAYDLVEKVKAGGAYAGYIKKAFGDSEDAWRAASPVTYAKESRSKPPFLFVSIERGNASHKTAERLAQRIRDAGGKAESRLLEGRDHFHANHLLGAPEDTTGKVLLDFVRK